MSIERVTPGFDTDNSTNDFHILESPTPGYCGQHPRLTIMIRDGFIHLDWTPVGATQFRLEYSIDPLFADEAAVTSVSLSDTTLTLPIQQTRQFYRVIGFQ